MPAAAFGTPSTLLLTASCWKINSCSTLVAFDEGGVGHSNPLGTPSMASRRGSIETSVAKSWKRIEKWFLSHDPDDVPTLSDPPHLAPGASEEQVAEAEEVLGVIFPKDLRASYLLHDGSYGVWILERGILLSLEKIADDWSMYRDFCDLNSDSYLPGWSDLSPSDRERALLGVKKVSWNTKWIPVAENGGGDHICIDADPDESGVIGQVFFRSHEVGPTTVLASSFLDLLEAYADELEQGKLFFDEWGDMQRRD